MPLMNIPTSTQNSRTAELLNSQIKIYFLMKNLMRQQQMESIQFSHNWSKVVSFEREPQNKENQGGNFGIPMVSEKWTRENSNFQWEK